MSETLKAPFPWFGGKSAIADLIWERFGPVPNYIEPFFGSGAVLLGRPDAPRTETVNDACGYIANFWRAVRLDPDSVAALADWPVNENDLHARHAWLVSRKADLRARLEGDPEWFDTKVAGWWVWGTCCWIGSGFCSGNGPWQVEETEGVRQLVHAGSAGQGINRKLVHAGDAGRGINRKRERLTGFSETGVNAVGSDRKPVIAGPAGGAAPLGENEDLREWFEKLSRRLRRVRVCCGDWSRITGPSVTSKHGLTGVFLDPPYSDDAERADNLYNEDSGDVAHDVRKWAIEQGRNPLMRIVLCGYEQEHAMPADWDCVAWKARGGFGSQAVNGNENCHKERIWFSPHCLRPAQENLL